MNFLDFVNDNISIGMSVKWFHEVQCNVIDRWIANDFKNLMILAPPGTGKTEIASKLLPLYLDTIFPSSSILCATYSNNQAESLKHTFIRNHGLLNDNVRFIGMENNTGRSNNYLIIDDLCRSMHDAENPETSQNLWNYYGSSLLTRLCVGGKQLMIASRLNENDVPGKILASKILLQDWKVIVFPLVAETDTAYRCKDSVLTNDYIPYGESVALFKHRIGINIFNSLYQQRPEPQISIY